AEDGIRDFHVTGVQTCALQISATQVCVVHADPHSCRLEPTDATYRTAQRGTFGEQNGQRYTRDDFQRTPLPGRKEGRGSGCQASRIEPAEKDRPGYSLLSGVLFQNQRNEADDRQGDRSRRLQGPLFRAGYEKRTRGIWTDYFLYVSNRQLRRHHQK